MAPVTKNLKSAWEYHIGTEWPEHDVTIDTETLSPAGIQVDGVRIWGKHLRLISVFDGRSKRTVEVANVYLGKAIDGDVVDEVAPAALAYLEAMIVEAAALPPSPGTNRL